MKRKFEVDEGGTDMFNVQIGGSSYRWAMLKCLLCYRVLIGVLDLRIENLMLYFFSHEIGIMHFPYELREYLASYNVL